MTREEGREEGGLEYPDDSVWVEASSRVERRGREEEEEGAGVIVGREEGEASGEPGEK